MADLIYSCSLRWTDTSPTFDPDVVRALKDDATADLSIGGPELAAAAFAAGLVDHCHLFLTPVIVGGGNRALPQGERLALELLESGASAAARSTSITTLERTNEPGRPATLTPSPRSSVDRAAVS